ncbi:protein DMP10 [Beta vulgaris subsp. vulgaris]|uniref:protein DMP10 n=1 Tax=Beta vulgaris subsp. vulgaris TaxID=3555 RepID=UPI00053F5C8F|nr:protein DMP10 [Beta vulgaris subsp. vulgaris]
MSNNLAKPQESASNKLPLEGPLLDPPKTRGPGSVHKTLASAANLANLLPTSTVLAFQALVPPFSHNGLCHLVNKYLTISLITVFALICFLSSFTDSFIGSNGKLYYGIATRKGLYVFNVLKWEEEERESSGDAKDLSKYRIMFIDFVHAFVSLVVFLVFALGDAHVLKCFLGDSADNDWVNSLLLNLPLGVGALSSFLFLLFPTNRRGIGYADMAAI